MAMPEVDGIGLTEVDRKPAIMVFLHRPSTAVKQQIRRDARGVPIRFVVTGGFVSASDNIVSGTQSLMGTAMAALRRCFSQSH